MWASRAHPCVAAQSTQQTPLDPGIGGTDVSIYRLITVTQAKNTTCVYDYYGRLALGSHLFPGSSLHANLLAEDLGTGALAHGMCRSPSRRSNRRKYPRR